MASCRHVVKAIQTAGHLLPIFPILGPFSCEATSFADPWPFGVDPRIHASDISGFGYGFGSGSCCFRHRPSRRQQKTNLKNISFSAYYFLKVHLHHFSKIKCQKGSVVDPEWFFSDPDPTFHRVSDPIPDPDPTPDPDPVWYPHKYTHIYIHTHTHKHTQTQTHIHIHTHIHTIVYM